MKKLIPILLILLFAKPIFSQQVNGQIMFSDNQFKLVKVWGTHEERGYAVGFLLGENVNDLFENYLMPAFGSYYSMARNVLATDAHIKIDSVYIYEAMGMAEGLNASGEMDMTVDYIDILLANSFLDFQNFLGKGLGLDNGCSSLISWGEATAGTELDGKCVISRHLDWDDQSVIIRNQVMIVHFPAEEDEQPWLLIGFAGQMSVLSGLNQSGVAVMQHMLSDESTVATLNRAYEPVWFTMRKAIESADYNGDGVSNCLDINDAVLANINGFADSYIITGAAPSTNIDNEKIATIIEVAPAEPYITIRNTDFEDGIPSENLYAANWTIGRNSQLHYCTRYNAVMSHIGTGTLIGKSENRNLMLDYSSSCSMGGGGNIQFMQYVPEDNYLALAYHTTLGTQACENTPIIYDTQELFEIPVFVNNIKKGKSLKAYPNPANSELTIYLPENITEDIAIIYSKWGVELKTIRVVSGNNKIDISDFAAGSYIIHLQQSGLNASFVKDK